VSTTIPEAKITIVSKPYHVLKFNHHDLYYTPYNKGRFFYSHATKQFLVHNPLTIEKNTKNKTLKMQNREKRN